MKAVLTLHAAVLAVLLALIGSAMVLQSWTSVALVFIGVCAHVGLLVLDRLHPETVPDPTGAELLAALEEHKVTTKAELDRLASLLAMAQQRPTRLRE